MMSVGRTSKVPLLPLPVMSFALPSSRRNGVGILYQRLFESQ
jgi:hypothetical protein